MGHELAVPTGFEPVSLGRKPKMLNQITLRHQYLKVGDVGRENPLTLTTGFQLRHSGSA